MMRARRFWGLTALGLVLLPAAFTGRMILAYGVNVPFWDQWEVGGLVAQAFDGTLTLGDLTRQQNESRLVVPRLLFLGLAWLTHYDVRYEMWGTFLLACLVLWHLHCLSRHTLAGTGRRRLWQLGLASAMVFSIVQWENWLWGIQLIVWVPLACVTSILVLAYSACTLRTKWVGSALLATLSTFSFAHGMVCWVLGMPSLLLHTGHGRWTRIRWLGFWLLCWGINMGLYFSTYVSPPYHPSFTAVLAEPLLALQYFGAVLGAPLGRGLEIPVLTQAPVVGWGMVLLFGGVCLVLWRQRHAPWLLYRTMGWLTLGSYTLLSAGATTLGRFGLGMPSALSSRYATAMCPLIITLIYLVPLVADLHRQRNAWPRAVWLQRGLLLLSLLLLVLHLATSRVISKTVAAVGRQRLAGQATLLFVRILPQESLTRTMYPSVSVLTTYATALDRHGLLAPGLRPDLRIVPPETQLLSARQTCGQFDVLQRHDAVTYRAHGWAVLPSHQGAAAGIVLASAATDGTFTIFALVHERTRRPDVARALRRRALVYAGWEHTFALPEAAGPMVTLAAWALDAHTGRLCRLHMTYEVEVATGQVQAIAP